jgi:2,3-dimethylmalate lyase
LGGIFAVSKLREVLNARAKNRVITAPGVYDMVSLRMAAAMGFEALYMTATALSPLIWACPTPGLQVTPTWSVG